MGSGNSIWNISVASGGWPHPPTPTERTGTNKPNCATHFSKNVIGKWKARWFASAMLLKVGLSVLPNERRAGLVWISTIFMEAVKNQRMATVEKLEYSIPHRWAVQVL